MGLASAIDRWRRRQEAMFTSEVIVERRVAEGAFDPNTGDVAAPDLETIYDGPALVRPNRGRGGETDLGGREITLRGAQLKVPVDTPLEADDAVRVTASTFDADLVGRRFRITDVLHDGWQIARVALMEEITRAPQEEP